MPSPLQDRLYALLRSSERYTKTDMVYLVSGGFWLNALFLVTSVFGLISTYFFTRYLSQNAYGTYQFILAGASLIGATTLTGMNSTVTRAVARGHTGDFEASVRFQLKFAFIPLICALGVAAWYLSAGQTTLGVAFIAVGLFLPLTTALNTWSGYLQGKKQFREMFIFGFANTVITYGSVLCVLLFSKNLLWIVVANFFSGLLSNLFLYMKARASLRTEHEGTRDSRTISDGVHLSLMGIPGTIANQLDALLIFHFIGAVPLAIYSLAMLVPEKIGGGFKFVYSIALPQFSQKSDDDLRSSVGRKLATLVLFLAIVAGAYALVAPFIFRIIFPAYTAAIPMTQVLAFAVFANATSIVQAALTAQGRVRELYALSIAVPIIKACALVGFLLLFGIWGIIWAQILVYIIAIVLPLMTFYRRRS